MSGPTALAAPCSLLAGLVLALVSAGKVHAGAIRAGFNGASLGATDDASSGAVSLGFTANFFGLEHTQVQVNNNGNLTFDGGLDGFTPSPLAATTRQIVAPFFADVDTRVGSTTAYGAGTVGGRDAFGATWSDVGHYAQQISKTNSFQVLLVDRSDTGDGNFDIEFNYDKIQWETGDSSGGTDGVGGDSARIGYSNGTGMADTFFEMPGSGVPGSFLDDGPAGTALVLNNLNSNVLGRYVFEIRNGGDVVAPDQDPPADDPPVQNDPVDNDLPDNAPQSAPEPGTLLLGLGGALILGYRMWQKKR